MSNYYLALGIEKDADINKIKKAYRICCKKYHPDTSPDKQQKQEFLIIQKAYETLTDKEKRKKYDRELESQKQSVHTFSDQDTIQNQKMFWNQHIKKYSSVLDNFFEGFVPGFFEDDFSHNKELYLELILSPDEAQRGGDFPVDIPVLEECSVCSGTGYWKSFMCTSCAGFGRFRSNRTFVLHVPGNCIHGAEARISLEGIGLTNVFLNIEIIIRTDNSL
ncbi:MAG: DnaJ domain-containing protein [Spirochaetales bacterium]|nr:DnaJ domain-containing protein [Spirochaetales bacterium]